MEGVMLMLRCMLMDHAAIAQHLAATNEQVVIILL
jgi:hypothetical protein